MIKTLTQVVDAKVVTQHGTGWNFTHSDNEISFPFAWKLEKLITSRNDYADWLFYQLWSNGNPGRRYACKTEDGKLVMVEFKDWDPYGGFRSDSGWTGQGHNLAIPLSEQVYKLALVSRQYVQTPGRDSLLIRLIEELSVE